MLYDSFQLSGFSKYQKIMNKSIKAYAYPLVIFVALINFIGCDYQVVVAQIDTKIGLKQSDALQKNHKIISLLQQNNLLIQAYGQVIQKSTTAANAYTAYFLQQNRCQSINPQTYFLSDVSSLPEDFCFIAPIGNDAKRIFNLSLQLADFQYIQDINQKLAEEQTAFNADYHSQSKLYSKLAQSADVHLKKAIKSFEQCMKKYANTKNPTPAECKSENDTLNARAEIYGTYRYREVTFGMASKGPFLSLEMKNGILNGSIDAVSRTFNNLRPLLQSLQQNYKQCIQNLENVKITTNAALLAAQQARNKVNNQNDKLSQIYTSIDNLITKIKADTAGFLPLVKSLQELLP